MCKVLWVSSLGPSARELDNLAVWLERGGIKKRDAEVEHVGAIAAREIARLAGDSGDSVVVTRLANLNELAIAAGLTALGIGYGGYIAHEASFEILDVSGGFL